MNLQIRQMMLKDVIPLSKMYMSLSENSKRFFYPFPFQVWKLIPMLIYISLSNKIGRYLQKVSPKLAFLSLLTIDAEQQIIVGFVYLRMKSLFSNSTYIANLGIVVRDNYQNKGIGSILMDKLITMANDSHIKKITLEVMAENKSAIRLYKKHGFKVEGAIKIKNLYDGKIYSGYEMAMGPYRGDQR